MRTVRSSQGQSALRRRAKVLTDQCDRESHAPCSNCRKRRETALCEPEDPAQTAAALTGGRVVPRHQPAMPSPAFAPQPLPMQTIPPLPPSVSALPRLPNGPPMPMVNPQTASDPGVVALYQRLSLLEGLLPRLIYLENMAATSQMGSPVAPSPNGSASSHLPTPASLQSTSQPPVASSSRSSVPFIKVEEGLEDEERHSPILSDTEDGSCSAHYVFPDHAATLNIEDMAMGVEGQSSRSRGCALNQSYRSADRADGTLGTSSITAEKLVRGESPPRACYDCNPNGDDAACEHGGTSSFVVQRATPFPSIYVKEMPPRAPQSDLSDSLAPSMRPVYDNLPTVAVSRALMQRYEREVHFRGALPALYAVLIRQSSSATCRRCLTRSSNSTRRASTARSARSIRHGSASTARCSHSRRRRSTRTTATSPNGPSPRRSARARLRLCGSTRRGSACTTRMPWCVLWLRGIALIRQHRPQIRCIQTLLYFDALLSLGASFYLPPSRQWSYNACVDSRAVKLTPQVCRSRLAQHGHPPGSQPRT